MSASWMISVGGRPYGPYTLEQLKSFHAQGRLAPYSLVARDQEEFHPANEDAELAPLFGGAAQSEAQAAADRPAEQQSGLHKFGQDGQPRGRTRYIVMSDLKSGSIAALNDEIFKFGPTFSFTAQTWVLTSEVSLNTLRTELIQKIGKLDALIVVDVTNDKAAWFNLGPEAEARMRRLWQRESVSA
jgi:GYF domain 2